VVSPEARPWWEVARAATLQKEAICKSPPAQCCVVAFVARIAAAGPSRRNAAAGVRCPQRFERTPARPGPSRNTRLKEAGMATLMESKCVPCKGGVAPLGADAIGKFASQVPEWQVMKVNGVDRIMRQFKFKTFGEALDFTTKVGKMAEEEGHHPDIYLAFGKVRVEVWTHKIKGLHENDFILAAKTDRFYQD
jgi:4a-hydroxytetrahydrobiopterin dehydratase